MRQNFFIKLFALLLVSTVVRGQPAAPNPSDFTKLVEVLPPSPNAGSLGKYGGIDLSLASGAANISLPIYNYTSIGLTVPLSLSYWSNGLRVDEMASQVGTGWSLNAGGVITRTVYGQPDDFAQRAVPPADFPNRTRNLINFMEGLVSEERSTTDAQPDLFAFNFTGNAGKFILDNNHQAILLLNSGIKIETDLASDDWNFRVTTVDGVQYYFGGSSARENTQKTQTGTGCGRTFPAFVATAWYLKKIVHPNKDIITFSYVPYGVSYVSGVSETMFSWDGSVSNSCILHVVHTPTPANTVCNDQLSVSGVLLDEINSTGGTKVKFNYSDINGGSNRVCVGIDVYQPGQTSAYKKFDLTYQYFNRPFLTRFVEKSNDGLLTKVYSLSYNDLASVPARLSNSQDDYGYFNGKDNSTLIPRPAAADKQLKFPSATANRSADPVYCQKGMLSSITYPTGGKDNIFYESNQVYQEVATYPPMTSVHAGATNSGPGGVGTIVYSDPAVVNFSQQARLDGNCVSNSEDGGDPLHDQTYIEVTDETNSTVVYSTTLTPGGNFTVILDLLGGHSYKIKAQSTGVVTGGAALNYMAGSVTYQNMNVNTAGMRVARVVSTDGITNVSTIKHYFYGRASDPAISSAGLIYTPVYEKSIKMYTPCEEGQPIDIVPPPAFPECAIASWGFFAMYSNTINNIYGYAGSAVTYSTVTESFGENFENGGIEYHYTVERDIPTHGLLGDDFIMGGPMTSYSWRNARETYEHVFKMQGSDRIPVKKVFTNYKEDSSVDADIKGYVVNKLYNYYCSQDAIPADQELNGYTMSEFSYLRKWVYVDTVRTWDYDVSGQNYIERLNISEYGNPAHALATKQTTWRSDLTSDVVSNFYPQDISLSGNEEVARQALVSNNMIAVSLKTTEVKNNVQVLNSTTAYNLFPNGEVLPVGKSLQIRDNPIEQRISYNKYNDFGKVSEQGKTGDVLHAYLWDYQSMYPVAECVNADLASIAYTSFEADGTGTWTIGSAQRIAGGITGKYCYQLTNGAVTRTGLAPAVNYTLSYWTTNPGSFSIAGSQGITVVKKVGDWTCFEHKISGVSQLTIPQTAGLIDELRLYPGGAQMTTYCYDPLIGMTSQCDLNNRVSYFEYDGLGRLHVVKDQDGNVIKTIDYHYKAQ